MKTLLPIVLLVSLFVAGCSSGRSLEGKWNATPGSMPKGSTVTAEFSGGNGLKMAMEMPQDMGGGQEVKLHADITGTYTLEGDTIKLVADDVKMSGSGFPAEIKAAFDASMKDMSAKLKEQINQEGSTKFAWVDDNTFTITGKAGKPETFTRAK